MPYMDYLQMRGNFTPNNLSSAQYSSGYFDQWSIGLSDLQDGNVKETVQNSRNPFLISSDGKWYFYDILFRPPLGILNCTKPLLPKTEFGLHFDRANSNLALIEKTDGAENPYKDKAIELENVYLEGKE